MVIAAPRRLFVVAEQQRPVRNEQSQCLVPFAYNSFQMFFETLYRVDPRGKTFLPGDNASLSETEYFQPQFELEFREGKHVFFIREKHGYFDDQQKKPASIITTLAPEEGFATADEAWKKYEERLRYRASQGFTHAFSVMIPENRINHRILDPSGDSLLPF